MLIFFGPHTKCVTLLALFLNNHQILINILSWRVIDIITIYRSPASNYYHMLLGWLRSWSNIATFSVDGG